MESTHFGTTKCAYLEDMINFQQVSAALLSAGVEASKLLYRLQLRRLFDLLQQDGKTVREVANVVLTSLNRSLYCQILSTLNLSLAECCYCCRAHGYHAQDSDGLLYAGEEIIARYSALLSAHAKGLQQLDAVCNYIAKHLEENLTLESICQHFFISKRHLCRCFRDVLDCTFCEYLRQQRMVRARTLLSTTNAPIETISGKCGFSSPAYFAAVFKTSYGITPRAFRQRCLEASLQQT